MERKVVAAAVLALGLGAGDALAQDGAAQDVATPPSGSHIALELNSLEPQEGGCRLSVLVENRMGVDIEDFAVEVAVFRAEGGLDRLLRLGFGPLLEARTRIRQFDLSESPCDAVGRVLVNDVAACDGDGLTPMACLRALTARSATPVAFGL